MKHHEVSGRRPFRHHAAHRGQRPQQLHGVAALLVEIEDRLERVAHLFDQLPRNGSEVVSPAGSPTAGLAFNPDATMRDAARRQALIDETFRSASQGPALS